MPEPPTLLICMGVAGSGKSTVAKAVADAHALTLIDADDFHPPANRDKMRRGVPLDDADRHPWMDAVCAHLQALAREHESCVLAHSALRAHDRQRLRQLDFHSAFLHLQAPRVVLAARLQTRKAHFFPADLLDSQLRALQLAADEQDVHSADATLPMETLVALAGSLTRAS